MFPSTSLGAAAQSLLPEPVQRALAVVEINFDPRHDHPTLGRAVFASLVAIVGSLVADAILVAIGVTVFPSTNGFPHFRFSDYATLTVIGVGAACVAWPIVSRTFTPAAFPARGGGEGLMGRAIPGSPCARSPWGYGPPRSPQSPCLALLRRRGARDSSRRPG